MNSNKLHFNSPTTPHMVDFNFYNIHALIQLNSFNNTVIDTYQTILSFNTLTLNRSLFFRPWNISECCDSQALIKLHAQSVTLIIRFHHDNDSFSPLWCCWKNWWAG